MSRRPGAGESGPRKRRQGQGQGQGRWTAGGGGLGRRRRGQEAAGEKERPPLWRSSLLEGENDFGRKWTKFGGGDAVKVPCRGGIRLGEGVKGGAGGMGALCVHFRRGEGGVRVW